MGKPPHPNNIRYIDVIVTEEELVILGRQNTRHLLHVEKFNIGTFPSLTTQKGYEMSISIFTLFQPCIWGDAPTMDHYSLQSWFFGRRNLSDMATTTLKGTWTRGEWTIIHGLEHEPEICITSRILIWSLLISTILNGNVNRRQCSNGLSGRKQ